MVISQECMTAEVLNSQKKQHNADFTRLGLEISLMLFSRARVDYMYK